MTPFTAWLAQLMADPRSTVRREILAEFQKSQSARSWPTVRLDRTVAELNAAAEGIQREINRMNTDKAARERAKTLEHMAADPMRIVRETEKLARKRSKEAYRQIATLLADLREALSGRDQSSLADQQARKLKKENPKLNRLTGALRRQGFVPK